MGKLPTGPLEVRLAATLFLLLLGVADLFGAWEVRNFAAFTPRAVAATVGPQERDPMGAMAMPGRAATVIAETRVDLATLDRPKHTIGRELLVQDTHVHVPVYALTAAALSLLVCGLALKSAVRVALVCLAYAAPLFDFVGLWGAHLLPGAGAFFGFVTVASGGAMGLAYAIVLVLTLWQCWFARARKEHHDA
ncbi:MAG TPA: hypothetical protein VOA87_09590 [Thermoanaerobaculia bacterium]|nr:hypothetical protein [Thermoanaerobaculia bacterium]